MMTTDVKTITAFSQTVEDEKKTKKGEKDKKGKTKVKKVYF
jgi:hypothetical protein